jgi:hypothetical protein
MVKPVDPQALMKVLAGMSSPQERNESGIVQVT